MGSLAFEKPAEGQIISGVLVKRNFKYQIVAPSDISSKFRMTYSWNLVLLRHYFRVHQHVHQ